MSLMPLQPESCTGSRFAKRSSWSLVSNKPTLLAASFTPQVWKQAHQGTAQGSRRHGANLPATCTILHGGLAVPHDRTGGAVVRALSSPCLQPETQASFAGWPAAGRGAQSYLQ